MMNLIKRDEDLLDVVREWRLAVHIAKPSR
jgi:hypothetical protein